MRKLKLTAIIAALLMTMSACSANTQYSEQDYNNIVSERDSLMQELESMKINATTSPKIIDTAPNDVETMEISTEPEEASPEPPEFEPISAGNGEAAGKVETERKFLLDIDKMPTELMGGADVYDLTQTYLCYSPEMRVRKIKTTKEYYRMTIKIPLDDVGLSRQEIEFKINEDEYNDLVKKQTGTTILKTRYQFWVDEHHVCIDVYSGELTGLAVAEIEFDSVEKADEFVPLEWFCEDITADKRYKNANLAKDGMPQ